MENGGGGAGRGLGLGRSLESQEATGPGEAEGGDVPPGFFRSVVSSECAWATGSQHPRQERTLSMAHRHPFAQVWR